MPNHQHRRTPAQIRVYQVIEVNDVGCELPLELEQPFTGGTQIRRFDPAAREIILQPAISGG